MTSCNAFSFPHSNYGDSHSSLTLHSRQTFSTVNSLTPLSFSKYIFTQSQNPLSLLHNTYTPVTFSNDDKTSSVHPQMEKVADALNYQSAQRKYHDKKSKLSSWFHKLYKDFLSKKKDVLEEGLEFLELVLPESILNVESFNNKNKKIYKGVELGGTFLKAIDCGFSVLTLFYKKRLLNESKSILEEIKDNYRKSDKPIPKEIAKWEKKLNSEIEKFDQNVTEKKNTLAKNCLSCLKAPFKLIPILETASFKESLLKCIALASACFGWIADLQKLKKAYNLINAAEVLMAKLQEWNRRVIPQVEIHSKNLTCVHLNQQLPRQISLSTKLQKLTLPAERNYEEECTDHLQKLSEIDEIRGFLKNYNVFLHPEIDNKKKFLLFLEKEEFKNQIVSFYSRQEELSYRLQHVIDNHKNLLEKREAIVETKLIKLRPRFLELIPELQKLKKGAFDKALDQIIQNMGNVPIERTRTEILELGIQVPFGLETDLEIGAYLNNLKDDPQNRLHLFNQWFFQHSVDSLLKSYIDHQETLEKMTRHALKHMLDKKYLLEGKFIQSNWYETSTHFLFTSVANVVALITALFTLNKLSSTQTLYRVITSIPLIASFGFFIKGYYMNHKYRRELFSLHSYYEKGMLIFNKFMLSREKLTALIARRNLAEISQRIKGLLSQDSLTSELYSKEKQKQILTHCEEKEQLVKSRKHKIENLQNSLQDKAWKDFKRFAFPEQNFDPLEALNMAMSNSNLSLYDKETKMFFKEQLGIHLDTLENAKEDDSRAVKNALKKYFALQDNKLVSFIASRVLARLVA